MYGYVTMDDREEKEGTEKEEKEIYKNIYINKKK